MRDAGADPRLRRPARPASSPVPCPPHRASPSAHQSPIASPLPRPLFRSLLYPIAGSRAEYDRKGERKGSYLLFRWVCAPTAHRRTPRLRGIRVPQGLVFDSQWFIPARAGKTIGRREGRTMRPAHPHAGGENTATQVDDNTIKGSSPRGRGKPRNVLPSLGRAGLIPARAGKTVCGWVCELGLRAHPRAGGENREGNTRSQFVFGSSPRGRGKRDDVRGELGCEGLIPARAGKTRDGTQCRSSAWAHPRVGGENGDGGNRTPRRVGSSPRRRGKRLRRLGSFQRPGLMPA